MRYASIPIKGELYLAIERHIPSGPLPIGSCTGNVFAGTLQQAQPYADQLKRLSEQDAVNCVRCERVAAWWVIDAATLVVAGRTGGDQWIKSGPVCKRCYDGLVAEAERGAHSQVVEIVGPAPGYEGVNAWLLAFHATQFTPGYSGLSLEAMIDRFPWLLSTTLEVVSWLKKAIRRGLGERDPYLFVCIGAVGGFVLALLLR